MRTLDGFNELELEGERLISGTVVQVRLVRGGWLTGVIIWYGGENQPTFRMILDGGTSTSPLTAEFPLPASAIVRLIPQEEP